MPLFVAVALSSIMISRMRSKVTYTPGRYTELKKLSEEDRGKNPEVTIMYSRSRQNNSVKKLWVHKPFFNEDHEKKYELPSATKEVLFGEIAVGLFGKTRAAKTKFSPELRGVISRILGDDESKVIDLCNFCNTDKTLPCEAQQTFLATIIYSLIIGDRDLNLENLIFKSSADVSNCVVYGIDREFAGSSEIKDRTSLEEAIIKIDKNPREIIRLLFDRNFNWNFYPRLDFFSEDEFENFFNRLLNSVTNEEFINALQCIVDAIAFDDFKICSDAKDKIYKELCQNRAIYSKDEIETVVVPNMDAAIDVVKNNVAIVKKTMAKLNEQRVIKRKCELNPRS